MNCVICDHPQRYEIEQAILHISSTNPSVTISSIAEEFGITENDIKRHAILHSPMGFEEGESESLVRKAKLKEVNLLEEVANEYMVTLKNVGRRINKYASNGDIAFEKLLSKPVSDLYIGLGSEIRQTVRAIADIDQLLNGPKEDNVSGLAALAAAINASKER